MTTLPGRRPEAPTSAIVSSAVRFCCKLEGGVQVTCLGFDDGRFLGMLKQRADLGAPSVNRDDEKTTRADAEQLAYLLQLFIGDHMPQVSGNALRAW